MPPSKADRAGGFGGSPAWGAGAPDPAGRSCFVRGLRPWSGPVPCRFSSMAVMEAWSDLEVSGWRVAEEGPADRFRDSHDPKRSAPNPGPVGRRGPPPVSGFILGTGKNTPRPMSVEGREGPSLCRAGEVRGMGGGPPRLVPGASGAGTSSSGSACQTPARPLWLMAWARGRPGVGAS